MSACTCQNSRARKEVVPGKIAWFWRVLAHPSELCEGGGYDSPRRHTTTSVVVCLRCLARWRTSARYADQLPEPSERELEQISAGVRQDGREPVLVSEDLAARSEARQYHVDYKMRAAGEA